MKRLSVFLSLCPVLAAAQSASCDNPMTQVKMNTCAAEAYADADATLNETYQDARDRAAVLDLSLPPDALPAAIALRDAQRAWIPFRDAACEAESLIVRGGSLQPLIFYSCMERLTRQRTEDLRLFGEMN